MSHTALPGDCKHVGLVLNDFRLVIGGEEHPVNAGHGFSQCRRIHVVTHENLDRSVKLGRLRWIPNIKPQGRPHDSQLMRYFSTEQSGGASDKNRIHTGYSYMIPGRAQRIEKLLRTAKAC